MSSARPAGGLSRRSPSGRSCGVAQCTVPATGRCHGTLLRRVPQADRCLSRSFLFVMESGNGGRKRRLFRFSGEILGFPRGWVVSWRWHLSRADSLAKMHVSEDVAEPSCDITGRHGQRGRGRAVWTLGSLAVVTDPGHLASRGLPCPTARGPPGLHGPCSAAEPGLCLVFRAAGRSAVSARLVSSNATLQRHATVFHLPGTGFMCADTCQRLFLETLRRDRWKLPVHFPAVVVLHSCYGEFNRLWTVCIQVFKIHSIPFSSMCDFIIYLFIF